jgi:hypothetical protein
MSRDLSKCGSICGWRVRRRDRVHDNQYARVDNVCIIHPEGERDNNLIF